MKAPPTGSALTHLLVLPLTDSGMICLPTTTTTATSASAATTKATTSAATTTTTIASASDVPLEALHVLRILLTVWLISLYNDIIKENGHYESSSVSESLQQCHVMIGSCFEVGGLLQTVVDGHPCLALGLLKTSSGISSTTAGKHWFIVTVKA